MSEPKELSKLCIMNAKEHEGDDEIRAICEEFGQLVRFNRPPNKRHLAFPHYQNPNDAKIAMEGLKVKGYKVDYANKRTADNASENSENGRGKRSEFRSRPNLTRDDVNGGTDFVEADSTGPDDNRPYGICIRCGEKAYHNCGRCGDFYCSEECQVSDWLSHKRVCFPMPKLVPAKSMFSLHASRVNVSKSVEKLRNEESNHVNVDAADGHEKVPVSPPTSPRRSIEKTPEKMQVTESVKKSPQQRLEDRPIVTAKDSNGTQDMSARQKVLLLSNCSDSDRRSTNAVTNGVILNTIPNDGEVLITHVKNYSSVYIRSYAANDEFSRLITEVDEASKTAPNLKSYPSRNEVVMAPFEGMYYRGFVISSNENAGTVRVGYMDFGNSEEVAFKSIKVLPKELKEERRYTFLVNLKNVKEEAEPNEAIAMVNHLESLSENASATLLKVKGDKPDITVKDYVELFHVISNQSVNETLNAMVQKRYRISDLKQNVVKGSHPLMAIGCDRIHENIITCIKKDDVNLFMAGDEKTQTYGESVKTAPAYKPKEKELCVVKIKEPEGEVWYRCLYQQELVEERAQVYCIDYGKISNARANNIRAMTSKLDHEIVSFVCLIKNGDSIPVDQRIKMINANPEFTPTSIEYDGDVHVIEMSF